MPKVKKNKEELISLTPEQMMDFIWMSYRYAIGRHTIAAHYHAGEIVPLMKYYSEERRQFTATDIRKEISQIIHFRDNIFVSGYGDEMDAITLLVKYMEENHLSLKEPDIIINNRLDIDTTTGIITFEPLPEDKIKEEKTYLKSWFYTDIEDALVWIKLANYLDKKCHRHIKYKDEEIEIFPFPEIDQLGNPEIKWAGVEQYEKTPQQNWYISRDALNFID